MLKSIKYIFFVYIILGNQLFASHFMGGDITWQCLSNGRYHFVMKLYRECNGMSYSSTEILYVTGCPTLSQIPMNLLPGGNPKDSSDGSLDGRTDLSPDCYNPLFEIHCNPNPFEGNTGAIEEWYFTSDAAYPNGVLLNGIPPSTGWVFSNTSCCRNPCSNLLNPTSTSWFLRAIMYPYNGSNAFPCYDNSPAFAEVPATVVCTGNPYHYTFNTQDVNNDSLAYSWAPSLDGSITTPVTYAPNYNYNHPFPGIIQNPSNIPALVNPYTGDVTFTSFTNGSYVAVIKIAEYRQGILIGEIFREIQVVLVSCGNSPIPVILPPFYNSQTGLSGFIDTVYAGENVNFDINTFTSGILPNNNPITLTVEANGIDFGANFSDVSSGCPYPPCATINPPPTISGQSNYLLHFHWLTSCLQNSQNGINACQAHNFTIHVADNTCQVPKVANATITIVIKQPAIEPPQIIDNILHPNGDVTLTWASSANSANFFNSYQIYYSGNINGPYIKIDSIFDYSINSKTYSGLGLISEPKYFFMTARTNCNVYSNTTSDTICCCNNDAGIINIITPLDYVFLGQNEIVKVIIKNFGQSPLTSLHVNYSVNGSIQSNELWSGNLLHNEVDTFVFSQQLNVINLNPITLCAQTILPSDFFIINDNFCKTINCFIKYDPGVIDILMPTMPVNSGDNKSVMIKIRNFGQDTLNHINIAYSVNGLQHANETWMGVLLPGDSTTYTFSNTFIVPPGNFELCAYPDFTPNSIVNNDTSCINLYGYFTSNLPYFDNFDAIQKNWYMPSVENAKWVIGVPDHPILNYCYSGTNACYVKSVNAIDTFSVYAYSQNFNFSNIVNAKMKFYRSYYIPNSDNGVRIEYTTNNGASWNLLGITNDTNATQWYNMNTISSSGSPAWSMATLSQYYQSSYNLTILNNIPIVRFRFVYSCLPYWNVNDIFSFDDFQLYVPYHKDAGVTMINYPTGQFAAGTSVPINVNLRNFGLDTLITIPVSYSINGNSPTTEFWTGSIPEDGTTMYQFANFFTIPEGNFTLCVYSQLVNDEYIFNDTACCDITGTSGIYQFSNNSFTLMDNIPNPVNDKTTIEYFLPNDGIIYFKVDNLIGQNVFYEREQAKSGKNYIIFDSRDLESGVYLFSIEYQNQKLIKRMVVTR